MLRIFVALLLLAFILDVRAQSYGLNTRPSFGAFNNGALPPNSSTISGTWSAVPVWPALTFLNPMGIVQEPGTQSMIVWEREGRVWRFDKATGTNKVKILDIAANCQGWDDGGLLNLVFHPNFAINRHVFIYYTWVPVGNVQGNSTVRPPTYKANWDRLSRFTMDVNGNLGSELVLMHQKSETVWHNGSGMFFHPADGFLYFINGDDFINARAQTLTRGLHSGIFRIDVDQRGGSISHPIPRQPLPGLQNDSGSYTQHYFIPNDNPFVGQPGVLEEYWALGVRSPHRLTFDAVTGRIFHSDVGDAAREEVNVVEPGDAAPNYQWPKFEGLVGSMTPPFIGKDKKPVLDYTHTDGSAVIGGVVYRGSEFPELYGKYIFGDNMVGTIWYLDESTTPASKVAICKLPNGPGPNSGESYVGLSSFGVDAAGELYMTQLSSTGGRVYKLSRTGGNPNTMPATLSATSIFSDLGTLATSGGFIAYDVNTPLWSDNALKRRWFAVPSGSNIAFSPAGEWTFPQGSVFVKHFDLNTDETNPNVVRRLETRVLVRDNQGFVYGGTYKWRNDLSDADLVSDTQTESLTITTAMGTRQQTWTFPGRQACLQCHTQPSKGVLGLNTRQSNRDHLFTETSSTDNQLRAWNHVGYFSPTISEAAIPSMSSLSALGNASASLESRARSYLDANCSHCHRPGGGARGYWDARFEVPLTAAGIVNGRSVGDLGTPGSRVVLPQDLPKSVLHKRLATATESYAMPPIAKALVDAEAVSLMADWINSLSPATPQSVSTPWATQDIGNTVLAGSATVLEGEFTLRGSGDDLGAASDAMRFVYRDLTGDGQIVARLVEVQNGNAETLAGVMIRESLTPTAKRAGTMQKSGGTLFSWRGTTPGSLASGAASWVRIRRSGSVFTSSVSADGVVWNQLGTQTISMAATVKIGFFVCSHDNGQLATVKFDNVQFMPLVPWLIDTPPQSQLVRVGELVEFYIDTLGDPPTSYQWRKTNVSIARAVSARYAFKAGLGSAGGYNVLTGGKLLSATANLAVIDKPVFASNLPPGATATFTVPVAGVGVSFQWLEDGQPLTSGSRILGATTNKLTVKLLSVADIGDYECVVTGYGSTHVLGPCHLHVLSKPAITAPAPSAWSVSRAFSWQLTADEPVSAYVVSGLPSGVTYNAATGLVSGTPNIGNSTGFTIRVYARNAAGTGATRDYTFVVEPFPATLVGASAGLVDRSALNNDLGGLLTLNIASTGAITGRITLGTLAYNLNMRAVFVSGSDPSVSHPLPGTPARVITLSLNALSGVITGDINGTPIYARHLVRASPSSYAGTFNTELRQPLIESARPQGTGWVRVIVSTAGAVTFSGRLPDATLLSSTASVRDDGSIAWHQLMYGNKGSIQGSPTLTVPSFAGTLSWQKTDKASATDRTYASGFPLTVIEVDGVKFAPIPTGNTFLGLTAARVEFTEGGIGLVAVTNKPDQNFTLTTAHKALFSTDYSNVNPCYDTLTITPSTGYFTGTVKLKDVSILRTLTYQGIFLNGRSEARGAFVLLQLPGSASSPFLSGAVRLHQAF